MTKKTRYQQAQDLLRDLHIKPSKIEEDTDGAIKAYWVRDMKNYDSGREYHDRLDSLIDYLLEVKDFKEKIKAGK